MAQTTPTLKEAKRLHKLGFAIHWLHPKSKRPVESAWTTGPRKTWEYLKETYTPGLNVGVRLGSPSKVGAWFLAVVDVDVKSTSERHRKEAIKAARAIVGNTNCPVVRSGRGNGSRHFYCVTETPFKGFDAVTSDDTVKVYMPSSKPSKRETENLTEAEIKEGMRLRPAWEISIMSEGRQVVLPPSIHPDSGEPYTWSSHVTQISELPLIHFAQPEESEEKKEKTVKENLTVKDFAVVPVELDWLEISDKIKAGIKTGEGVTDRSAYLLPASTALVRAGLSKNEVLTVLTDPDTFLGACAYEHAKTTNRKRAAQWVFKYTLANVIEESDPSEVFKKAGPLRANKKVVDREKQDHDLQEDVDWRAYFEKTQNGFPKPTLNNCKLIMQNVCATKDIVGRNEFAAQDFFLTDTPWRSKKGGEVRDIDINRFKFYCAERFRLEFSNNTINEAFMEIADVNRFHPVREYLNSLEWDGTPRIETWLKDYVGGVAPEPYLSAISRKFLVAMVKRVFEPGCKFDQVLILEGVQGSGKSSVARVLSDPWFSDAALNVGDKDAVLTMQSKWLMELGELTAFSRADLEVLKAFISQTHDRIRAPYGKRVEEFPRQSVFLGTTNSDEYLRDLTGNRRFWPVKVTAPDWDRLRIDRDQLFAEAVLFYKMDETIYLDDIELTSQAKEEQAKREAGDEWVSLVADILAGPGFPLREFELRDVASLMDEVGAHKLTPSDVQRVTRCLKLLSCESWREGHGGRRRLWKGSEKMLEKAQHEMKKLKESNTKKTSKVVQGTSKGPVDGKKPMVTDF